jgi:hypothetical protein
MGIPKAARSTPLHQLAELEGTGTGDQHQHGKRTNAKDLEETDPDCLHETTPAVHGYFFLL